MGTWPPYAAAAAAEGGCEGYGGGAPWGEGVYMVLYIAACCCC